MTRDGPWRARAATLEAIAWLALARMLIARVSFGRWRGWLGDPIAPEAAEPGLHLDTNLARRRLARAVERAARRLPGETLCLPRAMALQWMLRRRKLHGVLCIGVRPGERRGQLDDLHAWVTCSGEVLIGETEEPHAPLLALATARVPVNPGTRAFRDR